MDKHQRILLRKFHILLIFQNIVPKFLKNSVAKRKEVVQRKIVSLYDNREGKTLEVPQVPHDVDPKVFHKKYLTLNQPLVFKGLAKNWPCHQKWTFDFFGESFGKEIALMVEAEGLTNLGDKKGEFEISNISQIIKDIKQKTGRYLRFSPLLDRFPALKNDLGPEWLNKFRNPLSIAQGHQLFIGNGNTTTQLHNAMQSNFFIMIRGEKRWTLFDTKFNPVINPPEFKGVYNYSLVDVDNPDLKQYRNFDKIDRYRIILEEGDVLYVPPFMWHHVHNLSDSIGVGYRFGYLRGAFKHNWAFTIIRLLSNNPPLWKSIFYNLKDLNLIYAATNGNVKDILKKYESVKQKSKS